MKRIVEIVCCSVEDCISAVQAGAGRIELCAAIELGGLTPSIGLESEAAKMAGSVPICSMLRPRPGGFCYSKHEFFTMAVDAEELTYSSGLVFGILKEDRTIDIQRCKELVKPLGGVLNRREYVFHRAFDLVPDPFTALESLIDLGFARLLTSGCAPTAAEGVDMVKRLIEKADGRIEIMPGGGLRSSNLQTILQTGCTSVHLAPYRETQDPTGWSKYRAVDGDEVRRVAQLCS